MQSLKFYGRIVVGFINLLFYSLTVLCPLMISKFCVLLGKAFFPLEYYIFNTSLLKKIFDSFVWPACGLNTINKGLGHFILSV